MTLTRNNRIALELLFFIVLFFLSCDPRFQASWDFWLANIFFYLILFTHTIVNRVLIFPFLFPQKQYVKYIVLTLINVVLFALVHQWSINNLEIANYLNDCENINFWEATGSVLLSFCILISIEFFFQYLKLSAQQQQRDKLLYTLENNNLKAQLNPHFLFNSLNNAYGLSLAEPHRAPDYILSLSLLMRYQIESIKKDMVTLTEEIDFIQNYLNIEQERVANRCTISFYNNITPEQQSGNTLPPLLFMDLMENSVKHGTNTIEKSYIKVSTSLSNGELLFTCENSVPSKKTPVNGTQSGIDNLQKRLKLLGIKNNMDVSQTQQKYLVTLTITLTTK